MKVAVEKDEFVVQKNNRGFIHFHSEFIVRSYLQSCFFFFFFKCIA